VVTLFANDSTTVTKAHPWGRFYLTESVVDSVWVESGVLTLGVEAGATWYKADDFKLYYLGTGNDDTDIELPQVEMQPAHAGRQGIYDLFGRRVDIPTATGIYIVNGKKTLIRK